MRLSFNEHVLRAIKEDVRYDGRKKDEYRKVSVEYNVSANAEGSARVKIGDTEVIAGVKLSLEKPYPDSPDTGMLMVDVHLLPMSSPEFELGPPGIKAIELARVTDRGVRESGAVDMKALCIEPGEKVWFMAIDICTVNADGNLFDAASLAAMAAIQNTVFPSIAKDGTVDYKNPSKNKLPIKKEPLGVTVWKVGDTLVVDPTAQEEHVFDSRLTVTTLKNGEIVAMQKGGEGTLMADDVDNMVKIALKTAKDLRKAL